MYCSWDGQKCRVKPQFENFKTAPRHVLQEEDDDDDDDQDGND
jgi:hypothetical protein